MVTRVEACGNCGSRTRDGARKLLRVLVLGATVLVWVDVQSPTSVSFNSGSACKLQLDYLYNLAWCDCFRRAILVFGCSLVELSCVFPL